MIKYIKILIFLLAAFSLSAFSASQYSYRVAGPFFGSPLEACNAWYQDPKFFDQDLRDYTGNGVRMTGSTCLTRVNDMSIQILTSEYVPPDCPASDLGDMEVTIGWGSGAKAGSAISKYVIDPAVTSVGAQTFCVNKCLAKSSGEVKACARDQSASPNGYFRIFCTAPMVGVGGACGGGESSPQNPASEPPAQNGSKDGACPAGSVAAGQDPYGMTICKGVTPPKNPPPINTVTGAKTPDGNGGTNQSTINTVTNADGSTTKTTTTTNTAADGSSTTSSSTSTSAAPNGSPGTPSTPADASDMCKQHPELTVCQNSQVVGSCEAISCTGDAIQCATLRAAATLQCRDKEDRDGLKNNPAGALGDAIASGNDPMSGQIAGMLKGTSVDMSSQSMDQSGFLAGGTCFPDRSITVFGRTVRLSFATVCSNIQPLRYAFLAIGFIFAYLIVSKSVLQS